MRSFDSVIKRINLNEVLFYWYCSTDQPQALKATLPFLLTQKVSLSPKGMFDWPYFRLRINQIVL